MISCWNCTKNLRRKLSERQGSKAGRGYENMEKTQGRHGKKSRKGEPKLNMESTRSERLRQRRREEYSAKNKEVKRSVFRDKRTWMENKVVGGEKVTECGRNKELGSIVKTIAGERNRQPTGVKDIQGVLKTSTQESLQRWVEHFSEILNRDDPTNPVEEVATEEKRK